MQSQQVGILPPRSYLLARGERRVSGTVALSRALERLSKSRLGGESIPRESSADLQRVIASIVFCVGQRPGPKALRTAAIAKQDPPVSGPRTARFATGTEPDSSARCSLIVPD
jgi:hypothetical protein